MGVYIALPHIKLCAVAEERVRVKKRNRTKNERLVELLGFPPLFLFFFSPQSPPNDGDDYPPLFTRHLCGFSIVVFDLRGCVLICILPMVVYFL